MLVLRATLTIRDSAFSPPYQSIQPSKVQRLPGLTYLYRYGIQTLSKLSATTSLSAILVMYMMVLSMRRAMVGCSLALLHIKLNVEGG